jgi:hypothetical protein
MVARAYEASNHEAQDEDSGLAFLNEPNATRVFHMEGPEDLISYPLPHPAQV